MGIFEVAKELILGTRLKRLSERFLTDVSSIYKELGVDFEPPWFGIFFLLDRYGRLTVSEIAQNLDITKSGASQIISALERKGLIYLSIGKSDKRKKVVSLTSYGIEVLKKVKPIWKLMRANMKAILDEGENSKYMLDALSEIEAAFLKSSLADRVLKSVHESQYRLTPFKPKYFNSLRKLIFHWSFDFYVPHFINSLNEIVSNKQNTIVMALKEQETIAAVFALADDSSFNVILMDRNDIDNRVLVDMFDQFLKNNNRQIDSVEFDYDKVGIINILEQNNFILEKTDYFEYSSKKLAVYKRIDNNEQNI